jgi:hypothetical protein
MSWAENLALKGDMRTEYKILVEKPEVKRPRGRPRSRWEAKMSCRPKDVDWINLAQSMEQWRLLLTP